VKHAIYETKCKECILHKFINIWFVACRDVAVEKALTKSSKNAKKTDRTQWLNNILAMEDWNGKKKEIERK